MKAKTPKSSDEVGHQISADYRSHFEEMRDSSVATKSWAGISLSNANGHRVRFGFASS